MFGKALNAMQSRRPIVLITGGSRRPRQPWRSGAERLRCRHHLQVRARGAERVLERCRAAGANAVACQGDVAEEAEVVRLFDEAEAALGPLSHVVNNAGVTGKSGRLAEASVETIRTCIDINVLGALWVAREAARRLPGNPGDSARSIVNISSVAASLGSPNEYVWYAASKGAVDSLTIGLAKELAPTGSASTPSHPA